MTTDKHRAEGGLDEKLLTFIGEAGISASATKAAIEIDAVIQNWRRRAMKRELGRRALEDLKIGIDLAQLDVLAAIEGRQMEFPVSEGEETMVATIAERLAIDPSRASRIVSEVVAAGYALRAVSQADARRTIITLSDAGRSVIETVRAYKWMVMGDFLEGWSPEELRAFIPLLHRLSEWTNQLDERTAKFAPNIEKLAQNHHLKQEKPGGDE